MKKWINFALILTLAVIVMGATTRLEDAGLGCPDWPGCYGKLTVTAAAVDSDALAAFPDRPFEAYKAWLEMIHRYIASLLGLVILLLAVKSWRSPDGAKKLPLVLLLLVMFQGYLGMLTVTANLMPLVVLGHLIGGFSVLSLLYLWRLRLADSDPEDVPASGHKLALAGLVVLIAQISLGGWTSTNYAATACTALPICEQGWQQRLDVSAFNPNQGKHQSYEFGVLDYDARMTIHVSHRFGAIITFGLLMILAWRLLKQSSNQIKPVAKAMLALLLVQFTLGILNVVLLLPLSVAVAHNLVAALLLLSLIGINYQLRWQQWRLTWKS
ncbi:heme A synthase [Paraferrimonas sp. SM1919]|uniref:COX15/CtaA family protein n=1 Tax=Paraferrimonas sp. SM1919 TaxID=2662263 RepID=UPI0013D84B6B|nr:COX15/CtaA family protein [Paraferrimonas sp. SM1919]